MWECRRFLDPVNLCIQGDITWVDDHSPPYIANEDRMSTRVFMTAQTNGIQVDISKYPA